MSNAQPQREAKELVDWCMDTVKPSLPSAILKSALDKSRIESQTDLQLILQKFYLGPGRQDIEAKRQLAMQVCLGFGRYTLEFNVMLQQIPGIGLRRASAISTALINVVAANGCSFTDALANHIDEIQIQCEAEVSLMNVGVNEFNASVGRPALKSRKSVTAKELLLVKTWWLEQLESES